MILLNTDDHVFISADYAEMTSQLLEYLDVRDDDALISLAAACLGCTAIDIILTRTSK